MENVNHKNYFVKDKVDELAEKPADKLVSVSAIVREEETLNPYTEGYLFNLIKSEQVEILKEFGLTKTEINKLRTEKARVEMIMRLLE